jgi:ATP-dependent HslUV protease ATP-binding subunit HslU
MIKKVINNLEGDNINSSQKKSKLTSPKKSSSKKSDNKKITEFSLLDNLKINESSIVSEFKTNNEKIFDYIKQYVAGQVSSIKSLIAIYSQCQMRNKIKDTNLKSSIKPPHAVFLGPTGCGKSYMIGKLSEYLEIPFIKTEATQYTEVGYVGKDVEMMVKELVERSLQIVKDKYFKLIKEEVRTDVLKMIVKIILGSSEITDETYSIFVEKIINGEFNEKEIEIEVSEDMNHGMHTIDLPGSIGTQIGMMNFSDMVGKIFGKKNTKKIKTNVKEAIEKLIEEELLSRTDESKIIKEALKLAEETGIIFIDEIDKIIPNTMQSGSSRGDVSKEGVQRDLLPLLDGTVITTKYGKIKTDHILFIAAGAFHMNKFSDLIPEIQGRFPMNIKLHPLNESHFVDILNNKKNNLITQYIEMMKCENVEIEFTDNSIKLIAKIASDMNKNIENTGARRLRTIIDNIMEDLNFEFEHFKGKKLYIDEEYINQRLEKLNIDLDLHKFVL